MENILINIDSRFRNIQKYTDPGFFVYQMDDILKNISYVRLASIELPTAFYTFLNIYNNISFHIILEDETDIYIFIEEGNYSADQMVGKIQSLLNIQNSQYNTHLTFTWDNINYKTSFSNDKPFTLLCGNDLKHISLGYRLGFIYDDTNYLLANQPCIYDQATNTSSYVWTGDTFLNITKDEYLFLRINDYGIIHNNVREKSLLAKIILYDQQFVIDNGANLLTKLYKFKQPKNISKFEIELINSQGQTINMNFINFSLTLECGQIYNGKDYNKYNFTI
jgi:hypothetical protein